MPDAHVAEATGEVLPAAPIGQSHTELPTPARRRWRAPRWSRQSVAPISEHPEALPTDVLAAVDAASIIVRTKSVAEHVADEETVERRPLVGLLGYRPFLFDENTGARFLCKLFPELTEAQRGHAVRRLLARVIVEEEKKAAQMEQLFNPQKQQPKWGDWQPYRGPSWGWSNQE